MKEGTKTTLIIIGALGVVGTAIYITVQAPKKAAMIKSINDILDGKVKDPNAISSGQNIISADALSKLPVGNFPLAVGDSNQKVYALQQALNKNYGSTLDLDGKFGQGLYKELCSKYFNYGCSVLGISTYDRKIEQTDFDAINTHKN